MGKRGKGILVVGGNKYLHGGIGEIRREDNAVTMAMSPGSDLDSNLGSLLLTTL